MAQHREHSGKWGGGLHNVHTSDIYSTGNNTYPNFYQISLKVTEVPLLYTPAPAQSLSTNKGKKLVILNLLGRGKSYLRLRHIKSKSVAL